MKACRWDGGAASNPGRRNSRGWCKAALRRSGNRHPFPRRSCPFSLEVGGKKNFLRTFTPSGVLRSNCTLPSSPRTISNSGSAGLRWLLDDGADRRAIRRIQDNGLAVFPRVLEQHRFTNPRAPIRQAKFDIFIPQRLRFLGERRNGRNGRRRWDRPGRRANGRRLRSSGRGRTFRRGSRRRRDNRPHGRRRHVFRVVDLQRDEPNYAKGDGNPCLSIHKRCPRGYSQTKTRGRSRRGENAARDRDPVRPRGDSDKDGAIPATFREENRASRALRGSRPNRSAGNGIRSPVHPKKTTQAKRAIDNRESENARARASGR